MKSEMEGTMNRTFTCDSVKSAGQSSVLVEVNPPTAVPQSRKRSSGKQKAPQESTAAEKQNDDPLADGLNAAVVKKRKLQSGKAGFFGGYPVAD